MADGPWDAAEVEALRAMLRDGVAAEEAAHRLGRTTADVAERTRLLVKADARAEPSSGPDEEGDVGPPAGRGEGDPAAWVHASRSPS